MTKAKISEYDPSASNNTDVNGVNISEGCPPSGINDAIREVMAALKRFETGSDGDSVTVGGNLVVSGSTTISGSTIISGSTTVSNTFTASLVNVDNLQLDGNTISSTDTSGNVIIAPNSLGQIIVNAGAVGTPIIAPTGDTNTGIFFPAADTIAFAEGGAEAMRIDSSGNIGIGTSSPLQKLDIAATNNGLTSTTANNTLRFTDTDTSVANNQPLGKIEWYSVDTTTSARVGAYILATAQGTSGGGNLEFGTATNTGSVTEQMQITGAGDLQFNSGYGSVATAYGVRAWVNFDGTTNTGGNCDIRASGNVSSVADNATSRYTINFSTAMPDINYGVAGCAQSLNSGYIVHIYASNSGATALTTSSFPIKLTNDGGGSNDSSTVCISVFR